MTAEELTALSEKDNKAQVKNYYLDSLSANEFDYGGTESQVQDQEPIAVMTATPPHSTIALNNLNAAFQGADTTTDNDALMANVDDNDIEEANEPTNTGTNPPQSNVSSKQQDISKPLYS